MKSRLWVVPVLVAALLLAAVWLGMSNQARAVAGADQVASFQQQGSDEGGETGSEGEDLATSQEAEIEGQEIGQAQESDGVMDRTVTFIGTGQVRVEPAAVLVTLGVRTEDVEASAAFSQTSQQVQDVISAVIDSGVPERNIQTQVLRLQPRFEQPPVEVGQVPGTPELAGFEAINLVQVRVEDLELVGTVVDVAVEAGANMVENIQFVVDDQDELLANAREEAWNDALAKAEQLAELAAAELGEVLTINGTVGGPGPLPFAAEAFGRGGAPIQPGLETIEVTIQVTWRLVEPGAGAETE